MFRSIPTPSISVVEIGPITIHLYALCIISGVALAIWLGDKRFRAAFPNSPATVLTVESQIGFATKGVVADVALVAVPTGVIGGRLYHLITSPENYFGANGQLSNVFKIWEGGLGIWGAIALGGLGAFLAYRNLGRTRKLPQFRYFADALAPGILFAQAIGRFGNWFNAELFGRPTNLPWALEIPRWARPFSYEDFPTFHPTFLYESLWCLALGLLLIRYGKCLKGGQVFTLYIALYCLGRLGIEILRIDDAHHFFGIRLNVFVAILVGALSTAFFQGFSRNSR